jgi:holo-[acyl-carrier protein] synthase
VKVLCGTDVLEIERMRKAVVRSPALVERIFCPLEISYADAHKDPIPYLAARFCAKEAVMKLLGSGIGVISFREVEVVRTPSRRPKVELSGRAAIVAEELGVTSIDLSISHSHSVAVATAVAMVQG